MTREWTREWTAGQVFVLRHAGMPFDWVEELAAPADLLAAADALLDQEAAGDGSGGAQSWGDALHEYEKAFEAAQDEASAALRRVLCHDDVQEAIFLSNPDVYRNMLLPFLAEPRPLNARWRRVRRQLYTYVQRFCAKNETVSFFGPMAYGTARPGSEVRLRTDLPRRRRVFFAHWAARQVATAIARDRRLRGVLPFRLTGMPLPPDQDDLVGVLGDGGATLPHLAAALGAGLRDTARRLQVLVAAGCLEFGVAPGPYQLDPLAEMADRLSALPSSAGSSAGAAAVVQDWVRRLTELRELVQRLERAPLEARIVIVTELEQAFSAVTGGPARRGSGAIYADRAVFYEECSSPFALELGEEVLSAWVGRLTAALELSVAHGRTTQDAAGQQVRTVVGAGARMNLLEYGDFLRAAFDPGGSRFVPDHAPGYPPGQHGADRQRVIEELLDAAEQLPGDRYALVDLCPATGDVQRLADADLVLSRCHHHLLTPGWLGTMFGPDFGHDAADWVRSQPDLVGLDVGRRNKGYYQFPGRRVVLRAPSGSDAADPQLLWPDQLTVSSTDSTLRCTDPAGREVSLYLPLSDYVKYPPYAALSHPQVLHAVFDLQGADSAAVTVDSAVYQRPRWALDPAGLTAAAPQARFLALRRIARRRGIGRFVFCRTDSERKPYLIDLESVLAADLVAHIAKGSTAVTAEQMLPSPDSLWLRDDHGRRYTSELRMQLTGKERTP